MAKCKITVTDEKVIYLPESFKGTEKNDINYAITIYCNIFKVEEDDERDANIRGILNVLSNLPERERSALESRFRYGKSWEQVCIDIGVKKQEQAKNIINKAIRLLRHPSRTQFMSIEKIEKARDEYKQYAHKAYTKILDMKKQIILLMYNSPNIASPIKHWTNYAA